MQNPFTNPAFSMTALTNAINIMLINYGWVENLNLFPSRSVRFRHITIEDTVLYRQPSSTDMFV